MVNKKEFEGYICEISDKGCIYCEKEVIDNDR